MCATPQCPTGSHRKQARLKAPRNQYSVVAAAGDLGCPPQTSQRGHSGRRPRQSARRSRSSRAARDLSFKARAFPGVGKASAPCTRRSVTRSSGCARRPSRNQSSASAASQASGRPCERRTLARGFGCQQPACGHGQPTRAALPRRLSASWRIAASVAWSPCVSA